MSPTLPVEPVPAPVTVVVPCCNEEPALPGLAEALDRLVPALAPRYAPLFVLIDDGSDDGTWNAMQRLFGSRRDCQLLRHPANRGLAAAIRTGLEAATTEVVCTLDADCTYEPVQLARLLPLLVPGVDLVTASPYHPDGGVEGVPGWRLFLSRGLSRLYALVLEHRLHTYTSCFRVYRRASVLPLPVRHPGFLGVAELLGRLDLAGGRIVECPARLTSRKHGHSKMRVLRTIAGHLVLLAGFALERWRRSGRGGPDASGR
jgi:glycosyltransferase involved in cell wall biosynthesis